MNKYKMVKKNKTFSIWNAFDMSPSEVKEFKKASAETIMKLKATAKKIKDKSKKINSKVKKSTTKTKSNLKGKVKDYKFRRRSGLKTY